MVRYIIALLCVITSAINAQDTILLKKEKNFSWSAEARIEARPYAPLSAQTLSKEPVIIGIVNAKWKHVANFSYWASVDPLGKTGGDYHGLFTTLNPFGKKNKTVFLKSAHFFDYKFKGNYTSIMAVQVKVWKISFQPMWQVFGQRKPRQMFMSTFSEKSFKLSNWFIRENEKVSCLVGLGWEPKAFMLSERLALTVNLTYNRRLFGEFGSEDVFSTGFTFSPDFKK